MLVELNAHFLFIFSSEATPLIPTAITQMPHILDSSNGSTGGSSSSTAVGNGNLRGSRSALLAASSAGVLGNANQPQQRISNDMMKKVQQKWPKGKDFLFATWAFIIGKKNMKVHFV